MDNLAKSHPRQDSYKLIVEGRVKSQFKKYIIFWWSLTKKHQNKKKNIFTYCINLNLFWSNYMKHWKRKNEKWKSRSTLLIKWQWMIDTNKKSAKGLKERIVLNVSPKNANSKPHQKAHIPFSMKCNNHSIHKNSH